MAFNYNGTSPTEINYNGTSLTVLKYGTTAVWGKPYTLSIDAGANTTVTVNRTSSPNQHASTGNLSSGSVIYYGDTLTISYSVSSGYQISTHTVNGTTFTSGTSYTVSGNISVVTSAVASASWHTMYTGSYGPRQWTLPSKSSNSSYTLSKTTFSSLHNNTRTRITISIKWYEEYTTWGENTLTITLDTGGNWAIRQNRTNTNGTINDFTYNNSGGGSYCNFGLYEAGSGYLTFSYRSEASSSDGYYILNQPTITKIEQYY